MPQNDPAISLKAVSEFIDSQHLISDQEKIIKISEKFNINQNKADELLVQVSLYKKSRDLKLKKPSLLIKLENEFAADHEKIIEFFRELQGEMNVELAMVSRVSELSNGNFKELQDVVDYYKEFNVI